ncbi:MAG: N-hydroxyarylamine O-acetyltransferase [Caulobacteraceae bacterium]|nr:N-hydroxyarylamine O-acetyltransferase [Caulobacteraceae bacterium]
MFGAEIDLDCVDLDAYCARVGYRGPRDPTLSTLRELHRLHPAAIPFETFDARLGLGVDLAAPAIDAKLIRGGRGGYCFEQNILFLRALRSLGFDAEPLIARSLWGRAPGETHPRTHMAVRVGVEGRPWLADVGFGGCMMTTPIRLDLSEPQETRHEPARLSPLGDELRLERLIGGQWLPVYDLAPTRQRAADLMGANWLISTHPDSPFRHRLVVSRTCDEVRHVLVDARLTTRRSDRGAERRELGAAEMEACLSNLFGLPVMETWRPLLRRLASATTPNRPGG